MQLVALPSALDDRVQIERASFEALLPPLDAREIEHVIDQPREPLRLHHDDAQILRVLGCRFGAPALHQLGKHADGGERRLQLVRDIGDEIRLLLRERELPARIRHHQPAAARDGPQRRDDHEDQRAAQRARGFLQLLRAMQVERGFPVRQRFADLRRDKGPLPIPPVSPGGCVATGRALSSSSAERKRAQRRCRES